MSLITIVIASKIYLLGGSRRRLEGGGPTEVIRDEEGDEGGKGEVMGRRLRSWK
jgi:hypothetical protein